MDGRRFDHLARTLSAAGTRRGVFGFLSTLPLFGCLAALLGEAETDAKGRRKRRKKRHKHRQNRRHDNRKGQRKGKRKQRKRQCQPESASQTCAGQCGTVQNNCQQAVECGPCAPCQPPCAADALCLNGQCQPCTVTCPGGSCDAAALQTVLAAGGTVYACPGRYTGNLTIPQNVTVTLIGAGGGAGPDVNTILDANQSGRVVDIGSGTTVTLHGLRITGGIEDGGGGVDNGGALTLTACTAANNTSTGEGGGISNDFGGSLTLIDCTVTGNTANGSGGGIFQSSAQPVTLRNTVVESNDAGGTGGGIDILVGPVTITANSTVTGNTAGSNGGGVFNSGTVTCSAGGSVSGNTVNNMPNNCVDSVIPAGTGCATCPA